MRDNTEQTQAEATAPPVDWIVLSANALGFFIVALAVLYAEANGVVQQVASTTGPGAIF